MNIAVITGSGGLVGSESVSFLSNEFDLIIGVDNNLRAYFFGDNASTHWNVERLQNQFSNYRHYEVDIRNYDSLEKIFKDYNSDISLVIHLLLHSQVTTGPQRNH